MTFDNSGQVVRDALDGSTLGSAYGLRFLSPACPPQAGQIQPAQMGHF